MIASQKIGKSFMGALNYNLKKMFHSDKLQRAELLETNFTSMNPVQIKKEIDWIRQMRPNLNRYVYHTSLNFSKEEEGKLTNEKLLAIARDYLQSNGFTDNQYFIFRHYDADHPHLHLIVNRIRFDGEVVSDSNNYKKSEAILRRLEYQYNLIAVEPSSHVAVKAPKKDELEMIGRTGQPSEKMVLQEKVNIILNNSSVSIHQFITIAEKNGINFLFNVASTGRISGITYFHNGFKIKGQALGNKYKWAELIKTINYEQDRDGQAISEANSRTKERYGDFTRAEQINGENASDTRNGSNNLYIGNSADTKHDRREHENAETNTAGNTNYKDQPGETSKDIDLLLPSSADTLHYSYNDIHIEISDDEDDAKYRRRSRYTKR